MISELEDNDWELLLERIKEGKCTPFLGAGACFGKIPLAGDIAHIWAKKHDYPLEDSYDLTRVAQYLAVTRDSISPKNKMRDIITDSIKQINQQYFITPDEPHGVLADLPLPIYITTNYDNFMAEALKSRKKTPSPALCRWNAYLTKNYSTVKYGQTSLAVDLNPNKENPVVFHLHGYYESPDSMVLTEDDYLDFLVKISKKPRLLPSKIEAAFASTSILFLGYRISDWNFRVLFRMLTDYIVRNTVHAHISVQLTPIPPDFHESEFKPPQSPEILCKAIRAAGYPLSLKAQPDTVDWLNEFLQTPQFYSLYTAKYPETRFSPEIRTLAKKTQEYRNKEFSILDDNKKNDIKRLNRNVLQAAYTDETPVSREEIAQKYLNKYFSKCFKGQEIRVHWGSCREFASELKRRWEAFSK